MKPLGILTREALEKRKKLWAKERAKVEQREAKRSVRPRYVGKDLSRGEKSMQTRARNRARIRRAAIKAIARAKYLDRMAKKLIDR